MSKLLQFNGNTWVEIGKDGSPDTPQEIVAKVNSMPVEERFHIEDIWLLRKELDELRQLRTKNLGGGGFNYGSLDIHIVDDETPTEVPNDVITEFTLQKSPSPTSSLKVFKDGQRMKLGATKDYTFSGNTVTFTSAPLTDSIITFDYRV